VHPLAAIAARTIAANTALAEVLFMLSPEPEQFLTRKAARVNPDIVDLANLARG
jgi:hypothetical protein